MIRIALVALATLAAPAAHAANPSPLGVWARGDGKAIVRIEPCGGALCAINTWIRPGTPDEKVGDRLVLNVSPAGGALKGEAFDPQRRKSYRIQITTGDRSMVTRGCVFAGLLCKDMRWTREGGSR